MKETDKTKDISKLLSQIRSIAMEIIGKCFYILHAFNSYYQTSKSVFNRCVRRI